jgi:hypothetical protein
MLTKRFKTTRRQKTRRFRKYIMSGGATKANIDIYINDIKVEASQINSNTYDWEHLRVFISNILFRQKEIKDTSWVKLNTNEDGYYNKLVLDSGTEELMLYGKLMVNTEITTYKDDDDNIYINWPLTGLEYLLLDEQKNPKKLKFEVYSL